MALHTKQRNKCMDDLALQVPNAVMAAGDPPNALTKFIRNTEARVFAGMQSAPPQEMNEKYGLPKKGDLMFKQSICLCPAGVCWQY